MDSQLIKFHNITSLADVLILQKSFAFDLDEIQSIDNPRFEVVIDEGILLMEETVMKTIEVHVVADTDTVFAVIKVAYRFEIKGLKGYLLNEDEKATNTDLGEWLDNIVIATTRGIMYSELRGTFVDRAFLPLISPAVLKESK